MTPFIVIPAYNEATRLPRVINDLLAHGYEEIVVIDDGSQDNTYEAVKDFPIHLLQHCHNLGQGATLRTGIEFALRQKAEAIVTFDADGQHSVEEIKDFLSALESGYDVALGSRFLHANFHAPVTKKYLILKPAIYFNWFLTGLKLSDAHNGFRAFSRRAAELIEINQPRMAHATEIIAEIAKHQLSYQEIPVEISYQHYGQNFRAGLRVLGDLLKNKILS